MSTLPPTRRELAVLLEQELAWPAGPPDNRWSAAELRAFIDFHDAQVAHVPTAHIRKIKVIR